MRLIYRIGILLLLTGIWLTATGILLGGTIEITLAIMFIMIVVGMILITGIGIWRVSFGSFDRSRERFRNRTARLLWTGALLCLTIGMWYALRFALRGSWLPVISIPGMVATHGMWNAIGFTGLALLAMFIMRPWLRLKFDPIPFSRLRGGLRIGTDFFTRHKLETATDKQGRALSGDHIGQSVRGLMDRFDSFQSAELNVKSVPVSIRDFYENTRDYNLIVSAQWQLGFKRAGRLYARWISRRIEQMNFPTQEQTTQNAGQEASRLLSRIFPINSERDGRNRVRAWVRGYVRPDGSVERAIYAAAYSEHSDSNRTYMNIAFPVPGGNLTSILRLEWRPQRNELLLTSREHQKSPGDQGVYLVLPLLTIRLPLNESIYVWVESKSKKGRAGFVASESTNANANAKVEADALLRARHDMWLFGIPFLQLHYEMRSERLTPA
ncbi:MAG: YndJ family transporter [Leptospiraceae bacterium]|nr:YndJ family transporter [Leptospiraceae bacterium]